MITLALAQMVYFVALQARFTGGEDGIQAVPRGMLLGVVDLSDTLMMYYFVLAVFLIGFAVIVRTVHSPFGQVIKAIRENEPRAISLGYDADRYKLLAFILSAGSSGLAGSLKIAGLSAGFADRCPVDDVGRGGIDDPGRRARHSPWPGRRRVFSDSDAALLGPARLLGHRRSRCYFRVLRAGFPPRHRRGDRILCRRSPQPARHLAGGFGSHGQAGGGRDRHCTGRYVREVAHAERSADLLVGRPSPFGAAASRRIAAMLALQPINGVRLITDGEIGLGEVDPVCETAGAAS
jgi:hypothetical protein